MTRVVLLLECLESALLLFWLLRDGPFEYSFSGVLIQGSEFTAL